MNTDSDSERILVVDDETALMQALCETLRDSGFEVEGVDDPARALARLRQGGFGLVLTDLTMPGMDGIALLRAAQEVDPQLVGVVMTGKGTIATAVQAMQSGALDYVLKPFRIGAVLPVLRRAFVMRRLRVENAQLVQRLRERAAELEAANRDLDAFTRTASHDLRAPLNGVVGFAELLKLRFAAELPAEAATMVVQIIDGGRRMAQLIDDLMRLSRLGRLELRRERVDVQALVHEVFDELRRRDPPPRAELQVGALAPAQADRPLLRQVFVNLIANACKFTRDREAGRVWVASRREQSVDVYSVADNGIGFDMAQASQLFEPFHRLRNDYEGSGVGLSIVKRIVQQHDGRIWAESTPGRGACFSFTLGAGAPGTAHLT